MTLAAEWTTLRQALLQAEMDDDHLSLMEDVFHSGAMATLGLIADGTPVGALLNELVAYKNAYLATRLAQ